MDFIRYDPQVFFDNIKFDDKSKEYIKLEMLMNYLRESYSCFNPDLKQEMHPKKSMKKPQIIQFSKNLHSSKKMMMSCLNKLTSTNYQVIYKKIMLLNIF